LRKSGGLARRASILPAEFGEQGRHPVQRLAHHIRRVVRRCRPAGAAVDPDAAKTDIPGGDEIEVRAGADMDDVAGCDADRPVSMIENLPPRLVGLRLLRRDDLVDVPAELRDIPGDYVVIGVGDDAEL
jgi:hypothetical protein